MGQKKSNKKNKPKNQRRADRIQTPDGTPAPGKEVLSKDSEIEATGDNEASVELSGGNVPGGDEDDSAVSDHSDNDSEMNDAPVEDEPDAIPTWVQEIMMDVKDKADAVEQVFNLGIEKPDYEACTNFFVTLNQRIRASNQEHGVINLDTNTVPEATFSKTCELLRGQLEQAKSEDSREKAWKAVHQTQDVFMELNRRHGLPRKWNLSSKAVSVYIGTPDPEPRQILDPDGLEFYNIPARAEPVQGPSAPDDRDTELSELEALEARAMQDQRPYNSATVMRWWPKGSGSQTFVRYGGLSSPIYRIRAGSYENYNPTQVERVLTSLTRGSAKVVFRKNGVTTEDWKYSRRDIKRYIGVGWKIDDDDESSADPLSWIQPSSQAVYPQTRILVEWHDGTITLEGRSFIRRVTPGSALDGDKVIYQKASEMEYRHREEHEMDRSSAEEEGEDGEETEDEDEEEDEVRAHKSKTNKRRSKDSRRIHFVDSSDDSGEDSDDSIQPAKRKSRRYKSSYRPKTNRKRQEDEMGRLEEELASMRLKLEGNRRKLRGHSKRR